jgi:hypothetical protein
MGGPLVASVRKSSQNTTNSGSKEETNYLGHLIAAAASSILTTGFVYNVVIPFCKLVKDILRDIKSVMSESLILTGLLSSKLEASRFECTNEVYTHKAIVGKQSMLI